MYLCYSLKNCFWVQIIKNVKLDFYAYNSNFNSGKGIKVRTRLYKVSPQQRETNAACNLTLMQKTNCDGLRIECAFTAEEAKYICGLEKEVNIIIIFNAPN